MKQSHVVLDWTNRSWGKGTSICQLAFFLARQPTCRWLGSGPGSEPTQPLLLPQNAIGSQSSWEAADPTVLLRIKAPEKVPPRFIELFPFGPQTAPPPPNTPCLSYSFPRGCGGGRVCGPMFVCNRETSHGYVKLREKPRYLFLSFFCFSGGSPEKSPFAATKASLFAHRKVLGA